MQNSSALSSDILEVALEELLKPLLKRIQKDPSEKVRETSATILKTLFEVAPEVTSHSLQFAVPILVRGSFFMRCQPFFSAPQEGGSQVLSTMIPIPSTAQEELHDEH